MGEAKTLHYNLFMSIENENTEESLSIIHNIVSCQDSSYGKNGSLLDRYSHRDHFPSDPLSHSIRKENVSVARNLLENGCSPSIKHNRRYRNGYDFFFKVIGVPLFEPVVMKILEGTDDIIVDRDNNTVLHVICQRKLTSWLQMILSSPSQRHNLLSVANKYWYLPMHVAAHNNFLEYFQIVFNLDLDKSSKNDCGEKRAEISFAGCKVLENSSCKVDSGLYKTSGRPQNLLTEEKDIKQNDNIAESNSTTHCNQKIEIKTVKSKFHNRNKAGKNCLSKILRIDINTPVFGRDLAVLHIAAEHKYSELVKLLIKIGADISVVNVEKHPPLFTCLYSVKNDEVNPDCFDTCKTLIAAGAQVNGLYPYNKMRHSMFEVVGRERGGDQVSPLHMAAEIGHKNVLQLLLNNGADPKVRSNSLGKLPVQFAFENCQTECGHVLLNQNLYPERFLLSFRDNGFNSLFHSASNCDETIVNELVINYESCLDKPNLDNVFPLDKAIFHGNVYYIHAILDSCPHTLNNGHQQQLKTSPPLHRAASSPLTHIPLCQILLSYGADIYAKAYDKRNMAYRRALRSDCYENAVYLCEQMSHPFTTVERDELLEYGEKRMDIELRLRLKHRLENVPSLFMHCLDVTRQALIGNCHSFRFADSLQIPKKMIRALKYQDIDQC